MTLDRPAPAYHAEHGRLGPCRPREAAPGKGGWGVPTPLPPLRPVAPSYSFSWAGFIKIVDLQQYQLSIIADKKIQIQKKVMEDLRK